MKNKSSEVEEDYRHPNMHYSFSGIHMELDVYISSIKLAVEYQGQQHYRPFYCGGTSFQLQQFRDEEKRKAQ